MSDWPTCPQCAREGTQTDDHIFDGADYIEWWCEGCNILISKLTFTSEESLEYSKNVWNPLIAF